MLFSLLFYVSYANLGVGNLNSLFDGSEVQVARLAYDSLKIISLMSNEDQAYSVYSAQVRKLSLEKYNYTYGLFETVSSSFLLNTFES